MDLLMITHNRLEYLKKSLPSVLAMKGDFNLTIWDNYSENDVVDYLDSIEDPRVRLVFSVMNESLAAVTSRFFLDSREEFVGKIDPDIIVPPEWLERLIDAHQKAHLGFIGGFHFKEEDLVGKPRITDFNGVKVWQKHHIGGIFVIRREDFKGYGGEGVMGISEYQAEMGLPNGYLWDPILFVEHMEDPRSEHFIDNLEYNEYKQKTRGISIERYSAGIVNQNYMKENAD